MYERCPNNCDNFTLFEVYLDTENNAIIYRCWVCDWFKIESDPFYLSAWIVSVNQALAPIDIFQSLLTNKDVVGFLRPRLRGESHLNSSTAWEYTVGSDEYLRGEIDISYQTFLKQMIVLAATYIELIFREFFHSFSAANPSLLIKELARDKRFKQKAMDAVTFDKIMREEAKEALMKRAFDLMGDKEHWRVAKYLAERAPIKLDRNQLFDGLQSLIDQRNSIVHHNLPGLIDDNGIDVQQVYDSFKLILKLLYVLEKIAENNEIPYWKEFEYDYNKFIG